MVETAIQGIVLLIFDIFLIFAAGVVLLFMIVKVKRTDLRLLLGTLGTFAVIHGLFHMAGVLGQVVLAIGVLQPLSVLMLLAFGLLLLRRG